MNADETRPDWPSALGFNPARHVPDWLVGAWRRTALRRGDGTVDDSSDVLWIQTRNLFVDVRIAAGRPAAGADDATLAAQMG
ncbi:MAG: hypothetical protein KIS96_15985, partial [Bauldia sp.]|nr:hypothetical protein [Bauldia sp.]